jgi:FMN phosphatase YigB (HAD superfamily)
MPTWIKQLKVLAWDLDGTLYPPVLALEEAINGEILKALALSLACSETEAAVYYADKKKQLKSSTRVLNGAGIDGNDFFTKLWQELPLDRYIKPNPELHKLFKSSQQFIHVLHTNSNTLEVVERKLDCIGLSIDNFSEILTFPRAGCQKPDVEAFEMLLESTSQQPGQILYIGDRPEVDLIPASKVGLHTALVTYGRENLSGFKPDLVFETVKEVLKQLL